MNRKEYEKALKNLKSILEKQMPLETSSIFFLETTQMLIPVKKRVWGC